MTLWSGSFPALTLLLLFLQGVQLGALHAQAPPPPPVRYDGEQVVRAFPSDAVQVEALLAITDDVWSHHVHPGTPLDFRISASSRPLLDATGIPYEVLIADVQEAIDLASAPAVGPLGPTFYDDYATFDAVLTHLDSVAADHPDLVTLSDIGTSIEGRVIRAVRLTGPGTGKPGALVFSCQHAREWIAVMAPLFVIDTLADAYATDPEVQALLDAVELTFIPVVNPDGYVYSHEFVRLWRKNRRDNLDGTFGVDLNRNWSVEWGGPGSSGDTSSTTYRGTAPFSEPESSAVRDFILAHPELRAVVDVHSYSEVYLQPWGYTATLPPDHDALDAFGASFTAAMTEVHGLLYDHGPGGSILYIASGGSVDWVYGDRGISGGVLELRDDGTFGFLLPADQIVPTGEELTAGVRRLAEWVAAGVHIEFPAGVPDVIPADEPSTLAVEIHALPGFSVAPGSQLLWIAAGTAPFTSQPLTSLGGADFEGTIPATPCGESISLYATAESAAGDATSTPFLGQAQPVAADVLTIDVAFSDDGETDLGWTVSGDATDGQWDRGVPAGGGDRGDPPTDADGSGQCHLTDNVDGNSDVDGGSTTLTSPAIDASSGDPWISYWRWYSNSTGAAPEQDVFTVEISGDDGATWALLEEVGPAGPEVHGGWFHRSVRVADHVPLGPALRVRFTASDEPPGSVVEAGIDGVLVRSVGCVAGPEFVRGDANLDGSVDISDAVAALQHLFLGAPAPCEITLDANDDEILDVGDPVALLGALFDLGAPIPPPAAACGADPTPGGLTCAAPPPCP